MATANYIKGRWSLNGLRTRPQAILWSDNFGVIDDDVYINPSTGASTSYSLLVPEGTEYNNFIILSDHNRSSLSLSTQRIENKQRMINGTMRSYYVADKLQMSVSWEMLPSRSFNKDPDFNENTGKAEASNLQDYTVDGGAGGVEMLEWYENHPGPFWMLLAYDKYNEFENNKYDYLGQYNQIIQVYFTSFNYDIVRRGKNTYDFWNINLSVEEV